jgi:hypothetical protein
MFRFATDGIAKQCYIGSPGNLHSHLFYFTASQNTHVIDTFGDGANANPGRLFVQWKMECHDAVLRGCLFTNTDGYGMMLGGYDGQAYRVEVSDTRFQGCAFGMWLFSSSGDIQITENFFSGFTDGTASALAAGHDHLPSDGGLSVVGVTFARNTLGLNAPRGTGSPVLNVYDNYGLGPQYTWDVTESETIDDDSLYLLTDPPGWRNAWGYVDPGEFDATAPVVNNFAINGGAASSTTRSVTLNIAATDPGAGMGAAERFPFLLGGAMQFSDDGSSWSEVIPYSSTHDWTLSSGTGVNTVYARFRDVDGNWSSVTTDTISFTGP